MQDIKETNTLRIGSKGDKKPPRIVYRYGSQNNQIKWFLENRAFILQLEKDLIKKIKDGE
jgi:hypothetical protein